MPTLSTHKTRYIELMKNPLLFLHKIDNSNYDEQSNNWVEKIYWQSIDNDFRGAIPYNEIKGNHFGYALIVAGPVEDNEQQDKPKDKESIAFKVHAVNAYSLDDWRLVINSFIIRSQNPYDKYPFIHLLWMLNNCQWSSENIINAISQYDVRTQPFIINNALCRIGRCLSVTKQQLMQKALMHFNCNYQKYSPSIIKEALNSISPLPEGFADNTNIFGLVNMILESQGDDENPITRSIDEQTQNPFLRIYRWLQDDEATVDQSTLNSIYALSSHDIQMSIVKRYFHDIRLGKIQLDIELLKQFKDSKFSDFIRYRHCLYSPDDAINISIPLLCDCIITLRQTNGQSFQSFDGVLDFVMTHCDVTKPNISLGLDEFLPQCDGGAVYNTDFKGFIDYSVVCELDESKFTQENLVASIRNMLDQRPHQLYYACGCDKERKPLSEDLIQHCLSTCIVEKNTVNGVEKKEIRRFSCYASYPLENKWVVNDTDYLWINHFLKEPMPEVSWSNPHETCIIDIEQTSTELMGNYIRSLAERCEKTEDGYFIIKSDQIKKQTLLRQYSKPISMRIIPRSKMVVGIQFDVFDIYKNLREDENIKQHLSDYRVIEELFNKRESAELKKHVIETLKDELNIKEFNGDFFEMPYDRDLLEKLIGLYYFKGAIGEKSTSYEFRFLTSKRIKNYKPLCAPKSADSHNRATDLPYFWCQGLECFKNALSNQTLEKCSSWQQYSLYHMLEIIGYPQLKATEAGYEPEETVREFIACANRAMKKFKRLKCRNCGHLLYTDRSSGYNRYNYYSCINHTCPEYNHAIYLSYCFKCKKGLIDSRDSAKCPNGWYICPDCNSCCDDAQYERQAQRYILQNRQIPYRVTSMRGHGHNDKGQYFCHKCGKPMIYEENSYKCNNCKETTE